MVRAPSYPASWTLSTRSRPRRPGSWPDEQDPPRQARFADEGLLRHRPASLRAGNRGGGLPQHARGRSQDHPATRQGGHCRRPPGIRSEAAFSMPRLRRSVHHKRRSCDGRTGRCRRGPRGSGDAPAAAARGIIGPDAILGVSVRTPEEAAQAERSGADYVAANGVFSTPTKTDLDAPWASRASDG